MKNARQCVSLLVLLAAASGAVAAAEVPGDTAANPENLAAGAELLARVAAAVAADSTDELESIRFTYEMSGEIEGDEPSVRAVTYIMPDKMHQVVPTATGEASIVVDHDSVVMRSAIGQMPLPPEAVAAARVALGREMIVIVGNAGNDELEAVAAGRDAVDGVECDVLQVAFLGGKSWLYVDGDGSVVKQTYTGQHPMSGDPGVIEVYFSDYELWDGRRLPRTQRLAFDGAELAVVTIASVEVNPEIELPEPLSGDSEGHSH